MSIDNWLDAKQRIKKGRVSFKNKNEKDKLK
jgi:hypothetical protein